MSSLSFNDLLAKVLGVAVLLGSFFVKLPQVWAIHKTKDVEGLSPLSFYTDIPLVTTYVVYNYHRGNPITSYAENIVILVQNVVLVAYLWRYMRPQPTVQSKLLIAAGLLIVLVVSLLLPEQYQFILPVLQVPLLIITRVPQILANFKNKSTGQLSVVTVALTFVGTLVRVFTTIQEVGWDASLLSGTLLGAFTGLLLLLQIVFYKKVADKKKKK